MATFRMLLSALALVGAASAAESMVAQAAARAEQKAAAAPKSLALEFRLQTAQALKERDPVLSRKMLDSILTELRAGKDLALSSGMLQALVEVSPKDAIGIVPQLRPGTAQTLVMMLQRANHPEEALALFREIAAKFTEPLDPAAQSLKQAGLSVAHSFEPIAHTTARAFDFFAREMPVLDFSKNE